MTVTRHLAAVLALALVTAAPAAEPASVPSEANAWALWVHLPGQPLVEIATASALAGGDPAATAAPASVAGAAPRRVRADRDTPQHADSLWAWIDPTASMTVSGAGMEATAGGGAAFARVSLATGAGSGFAMADELLTWEQQEQMLQAWADANAAVFDLANQGLELLGPVLSPRNIVLPRLEPIAPLGFVDVAGVEQMAARAEAVSSPGFASAAAAADVSRVKLFGGFVELDDVRVSVRTEQTGEARTARPTVSIGRARVAGVEVDLTEQGLAVATNDLVSRAVLQPVLDAVVEQLDAVGIRMRTAASRDVDGRQQVTAFELEVAMPEGMAVVSVGHAEASVGQPEAPGEPPAPRPAAPPAAPPEATPAPSTSNPAAPSPLPPGRPTVSALPNPAPPGVAPAAQVEGAVPAVALRLRPPPAAAARALTLAYVLAGAGGLAGAAIVLALVGGAAVRPRRSGSRRATDNHRARRTQE